MGLKKSKFTADNSVPSGSTFDFVSNGQNFKITREDLIAALGFTGSLNQDGAVSGVPVLDVSSAPDYLIRNLEAGDGIALSVSPENGLKINVTEGQVAGALGWEFLLDTEYLTPETGFDLTADVWARIPNNGFQIPTATNLPDGIFTYYDAGVDKFNFPLVEQWFDFSINFGIQPSTANATVQVRGLIDTGGGANFYGPTVQPLAVDAGENNVFAIQTSFPITESVRDNGIYYEVKCSSDAKLYLSAYLLSVVVNKNG